MVLKTIYSLLIVTQENSYSTVLETVVGAQYPLPAGRK